MTVNRILVIQTAFLGDVLLTVPFLKKLRKKYPESQISYVARRGVGELLLSSQLVQELYEIKKGEQSSYQVVLQQLQETEFDLVFCPHESWRTLLFLRKIRAKKKIGFKTWGSFLFFHHSVEKRIQWPEPLRILSLMEPLDPEVTLEIENRTASVNPYALDERKHLIFDTSDYSMGLRSELEVAFPSSVATAPVFSPPLISTTRKKTCLIFPGSVWSTKRWREEHYRELVLRFAENEVDVILMGSAGESALCERIRGTSQVKNFAGETTLLETVQMMTKADLVLGNDSGSAHLASAAEVPSLTIFGPTVLEFGYRPWSNSASILEDKNLACRPCGPHGHHQCPLGTHACMKNVSVNRVFSKAMEIINSHHC